MVEESHDAGDRPEGEAALPRLLHGLILGALGIAAALRFLTREASVPAPAPVAEPPRPQVEEVHHADGRIEHPHVRYEPTDARFRPILLILIGAAALAVVVFAGVWWFFRAEQDYQAAVKRTDFPLQPGPSEALPAEPRLEQVNRMAGIEKGNVYEREASKEAILHSYGDTPETGYIRIPIERAMGLLAGKLPARAEKPDKKANGLVDAGESNSGRMFRGKPQWYER
jgi:hypothetical protein